ncbi:TPA: pirin family protein [Pseudomonas aeruginosa]|uniref:pirin family protein n=1 Tax=Pseudomonas aeruginosa TaxID=287 RepID=UPI001912D880|nr:pirin family protein [Pseudomonas aeruginosa]
MKNPVLSINSLGSPWQGVDPFLFCAYHVDHYPAGNGSLGLSDTQKSANNYRMYYGKSVPGFPRHPHRGFETVTIVRQGYVDHSDSLGAKARYGKGDVQWLTAGSGVQHAEMFPLLNTDVPNTLELFQIWLNLPARKKLVRPAFKMFWAEEIPYYCSGGAEVEVIAGRLHPLDGSYPLDPPLPPENSWAFQDEAELAIWLIKLKPNASLLLPAATRAETKRSLYIFQDKMLHIAMQPVRGKSIVTVDPLHPLPLTNNDAEEIQILLLQGVPIGEKVAMSGPFVMNSSEEIYQAEIDYATTQFGDWPWQSDQPTHGNKKERFIYHPDTLKQTPPTKNRKTEK